MKVDKRTPEEENKHHRYLGNFIPWNVPVLWVLFAIFVIYYTLRWIFPAMRTELVTPP
jgi:hypothetical protein